MCLSKFFKEKKVRQEILKMDDITLDSKVTIQGTQFDRKRKLNDKQLDQIQDRLSKNIPIETIAKEFNVSEWVIKYNTDLKFREHQLQLRSGKHTGVDTMTFENRVNYKRNLIKDKKIKVVGLI